MFCSNCGKSLKSEHTVCPFCGMTVGESRFDSNRGYTGAQTRLRPGQAVRVNNSYGNHYSTSFNVESSRAKADLPSDEDSSYRAARGASVTGYGENDDREPLFNSEEDYGPEEAEAPEEEREEREPAREEKRSFRSLFLRRDEKEEPAEEDQAPSDQDADDYELTEEEKNAIRLSETPSQPNAGISEDVRRFMSGLRDEYDRKTREQEKKLARKNLKKQQDDKKDKELGYEAYGEETRADRKKRRAAYDEDYESDETEAEEEDFAPEDEPEKPEKPKKAEKQKKASRKQIRVAKEFFKRTRPEEDFDDFDPEEIDESEEEFEDESGNEYLDEYDDDTIDEELRRANRLKILRMGLAILTGLLLIVGGILLFKTISGKQKDTAPVPDVSLELWNKGTELMMSRVSDEYISEKMALYNASDPSAAWGRFSASFTDDLDRLNDLLPPSDTRQLNDQLFVDALKSIQTNINNCLSNDWLFMMNTSMTETQKRAESEQRWQVVRNQVTMLINAKSKGELDAVRKSEVVTYTAQDDKKEEPETQKVEEVVYTSLQKGSSGEEVIKLQTRLTNLGYLNDTVDGKYGNKTVTAVQLFQKAVGLKQSGIADEETQRLLYAADAPMNSN